MLDYALPILFALLIWWFSTGAVLYLDGLPARTYRWTMIGASLVLADAVVGVVATAGDRSVSAAFVAFTSGLLIWGWHELSYYTGFVTGPRKSRCPPDCGVVRRFSLAVLTSLWHELAIVATAAALWLVTREAPNQLAFWTFCVLWWMRWSAKLNVFFGVPNLNEDWLPEHLRFLQSYYPRRPMNLLFPVSVTAGTVVVVLLALAARGGDAYEVAGHVLLATLLGLAVLEHWFLVLPVRDSALWSWGMRSRDEAGAIRRSLHALGGRLSAHFHGWLRAPGPAVAPVPATGHGLERPDAGQVGAPPAGRSR